ncbi:maleylpyruvate isomerase family mycothiol-dependent enzyme [Streptomyces sp. NPDC046197]|uniref:maleylpyruvate isomerase family mycothiol-dependent enzyme n=1 Tax=Streptomyces sp. NPDC046197 TaxID=3154337 RepID=UPI0033F1E19B
MSTDVIEALRADREALLEICAGLTDAEWKAESGCPGWSVRDVVIHLGALFTAVVAPGTLPDTTGLPTERAQDVYVEARRSWPTERVVADYTTVGERALQALAVLARSADREVHLGDLGTYPAATVPCAFVFDHFVHLRHDLFAPRGPLTGPPPPVDELRLEPTLRWIEAALPQQNRAAVAALTGSVDIVVEGPVRRVLRIGAGGRTARVVTEAESFVRWITGRGDLDAPDVAVFGDPLQGPVLRGLRVW